MDLELVERVVLVSGGSSGIGEAIVRQFLNEGCRVINTSLKPPIDPINHEHYHFIQADLTTPDNCQKVITEVLQQFQGIDVLVNNAGVNDMVGLSAPPEQFLVSLQKNLLHYFSLAHYAADSIKARTGNIINIGSKVSVTGQKGTSGYAAAKGGINSLTREWALELAENGVRVNAVIPAEVATPQYESWLQKQKGSEPLLNQFQELIPLDNRLTQPEEVADLVVFLASARASHITGQLLFVDGGYTHLDRKAHL